MSGTFHSTCRVSEALGDAISACEAIANKHDSGPVIRHRVHAAYCVGRSACCLQGARKETRESLLVSEDIRCNRGGRSSGFHAAPLARQRLLDQERGRQQGRESVRMPCAGELWQLLPQFPACGRRGPRLSPGPRPGSP